MAYDMYYDDDSEEEYDFGDSPTVEPQPKIEEPRVAKAAARPSDNVSGYSPPQQTTQLLTKGRGASRFKLSNTPSSRKLQQAEELRVTIEHGNVKEAERILGEGFDPNCQLSNGWTGLMCACDVANLELVELLLNQGSSPNAHKDMMTALMVLCANRRKGEEKKVVECAKLMVAKGACVDAQDRYCMTALMYACQRGRVELAKFLISVGADVNKQDCRGWTPLCFAADSGSRGLVAVLLEGGADPCVVSHMGDTPAMLAYAKEHQSLGELLEEAAGKRRGGASIGGDVACHRKEVLPKAESISVGSLTYGDLELFLLGLQQRDLIPVFKAHNVSFADLLSLADQDLEKMGIDQVGTRSKLLEGIAGIHKKQWKMVPSDGLPKRTISCLEAAAILSNLATHIRYLQGTSSYLLAQVSSNPDLQDPSMETLEMKKMLENLSAATAATDELYKEMARVEHSVGKTTTLHTTQQEQHCSSTIIRVLPPIVLATVALAGLYLVQTRFISR